MNTPSSPIANHHNLQAAHDKIYEWVLVNCSPAIFASKFSPLILMNYESMAQTNCWVMIQYNPPSNSFVFEAKIGIALPLVMHQKILRFLDAARENLLTPLMYDSVDNSVLARQYIELTDAELQDSEIEAAFECVCKAIDDSTPPILEMIYGVMSVEEAIATYEKAQAVSLAEWRASFTFWESRGMENETFH